MTPTVHVPAMLAFQVNGQWINRQVIVIGVDEKTAASASDIPQHTLHPQNREQLSFDLREKGYDTRDRWAGAEAPVRRD